MYSIRFGFFVYEFERRITVVEPKFDALCTHTDNLLDLDPIQSRPTAFETYSKFVFWSFIYSRLRTMPVVQLVVEQRARLSNSRRPASLVSRAANRFSSVHTSVGAGPLGHSRHFELIEGQLKRFKWWIICFDHKLFSFQNLELWASRTASETTSRATSRTTSRATSRAIRRRWQSAGDVVDKR